jgi:hypothetical protein
MGIELDFTLWGGLCGRDDRQRGNIRILWSSLFVVVWLNYPMNCLPTWELMCVVTGKSGAKSNSKSRSKKASFHARIDGQWSMP